MSAGAALSDALLLVQDVAGTARVRAVVASWSATAGAGAATAGVLERVAAAFEADDAVAQELAAAAAGPQATVAVLTALPLLGIGLGQAMGLPSLHVLLHSGVGAALMVGAAALDAVGLLWVRRILRAGTP